MIQKLNAIIKQQLYDFKFSWNKKTLQIGPIYKTGRIIWSTWFQNWTFFISYNVDILWIWTFIKAYWTFFYFKLNTFLYKIGYKTFFVISGYGWIDTFMLKIQIKMSFHLTLDPNSTDAWSNFIMPYVVQIIKYSLFY